MEGVVQLSVHRCCNNSACFDTIPTMVQLCGTYARIRALVQSPKGRDRLRVLRERRRRTKRIGCNCNCLSPLQPALPLLLIDTVLMDTDPSSFLFEMKKSMSFNFFLSDNITPINNKASVSHHFGSQLRLPLHR